VAEHAVLSQAAQTSFETNALLPAVLVLIFGLIWFSDRRRGGYRAERLDG
jgi:hypothetical protein